MPVHYLSSTYFIPLLPRLVFGVLLMDNINGNMARKPDPPGADYFEVSRVKSHFKSDCSVSTMTDPPPSESHWQTEVNVHSSLRMKWVVPMWVVLLLILPMIHQ